MAGLGVVVLVVALGALALALHGAPRRARRSRRVRRHSWLRERPLPPAEAERRAERLLRSVVNPDEWAMYRALGFICVTGRRPPRNGRERPPRYRYMIYPHRPVVALLPRSLAPVREYCVQFPEHDGERSAPLPAGDDVLAKWMTLRADEERLLSFANVCNAGCQVPLSQIERDLRRLRRWQSQRARRRAAWEGVEPAPALRSRPGRARPAR